jgi:hypothetical protein
MRSVDARLKQTTNLGLMAARCRTEEQAMMGASESGVRNGAYLLRYRSLFEDGRGLAFPCDARGLVDLDSLTQRARDNYLYARAVVGRDFGLPEVEVAVVPH